MLFSHLFLIFSVVMRRQYLMSFSSFPMHRFSVSMASPLFRLLIGTFHLLP